MDIGKELTEAQEEERRKDIGVRFVALLLILLIGTLRISCISYFLSISASTSSILCLSVLEARFFTAMSGWWWPLPLLVSTHFSSRPLT